MPGFNLEKFIGTVPEGEFTARITKVEAGTAQDGSKKLMFYADFPEVELTNKLWSRSLKPQALAMLRDDLAAAEVLREGDSYPDPETETDELASVIEGDLSDRYVRVKVSAGKSGYQNFKIIGLALAAA